MATQAEGSSRSELLVERAAMALVPLLSMATLAVGLRLGASPAVRAAVVYGAPPGTGRERLAWQMVTLVDDRGVREAVSLSRLHVVARGKGREARWDGATNADGVAEIALDLPGVGAGDRVDLEVRSDDEKTPLASGPATWPTEAVRGPARLGSSFVRPSKQEGDLVLDVVVYGGRLAPDFAGPFYVRVRDRRTGLGVPDAQVFPEAEPGLVVRVDLGDNPVYASRTNADGWAELAATPQIHVVALGLRAEKKDGDTVQRGSWYGALPVAPGATHVSMPLSVGPGEPQTFMVMVPTVLPRVYAEIDDEVGRVFAAALPVTRGDFGTGASFEVPPLRAGTYWLVTSGEPRGAETLAGSAVARPFLVADGPAKPDTGPRLALLPAPSFQRFVALDGLPGKRRADGKRHRLGFALAFGSLALGALVEAMLILRAVARSKEALAILEGDVGVRVEKPRSGINVILGLAVALLGFGLLLALLTWKAS